MSILDKVARRERLFGVERQLGKFALMLPVLAWIFSKMNLIIAVIVGIIAVIIAMKLTNIDEDCYYVFTARRRWKASRSSTGESGSWYG